MILHNILSVKSVLEIKNGLNHFGIVDAEIVGTDGEKAGDATGVIIHFGLALML